MIRVRISFDESVRDVRRDSLRNIKAVDASADEGIWLSRVAASAGKVSFMRISLSPDVN